MDRVKLIFSLVLLIIMSAQFSRANLLLADEAVKVIRVNSGDSPRVSPGSGYTTFNIELVGKELIKSYV
ncbi:MAG: hypothetical protein H6Q20_2612 [Bacteroidetes bacterium]|nr:hypothetical protein [Bacteroidota bacterium]